jgi:hypothetical protein
VPALENLSKRMKAEDVLHVDRLLKTLSRMSQQDPPAALRENLKALAAERLSGTPNHGARDRVTERKGFVGFKPVFIAGGCAALGLAIVFAVHLQRQERPRKDKTVIASHPDAKPATEFPSESVPFTAPKPSHHTAHFVPGRSVGSQQMTIRLAYSNNLIQTGTATTLRVSMAQSELLALGFPMNTTVQDRPIMTEVTLGDDGLPRAISVRLPPEIVKEKK